MKVIIISTDPSILSWETVLDKRATIIDTLNQARNATFGVEVIHDPNLTPTVHNGRVSASWFDTFARPYYLQGYHFVGLHMSEDQHREWGIQSTLRGSRYNDRDQVGEFYFWADEHTTRGNGPHNQFIETCLHEIRHEICAGTGTPDDTHDIHDVYTSITHHFSHFDMSRYRQRSRIQLKIIQLLTKAITMIDTFLTRSRELIHPVEGWKSLITQDYGVPNQTWYPRTGHHIGIDYNTPENTAVLAPMDGEVTVAGHSNALGNFCHFRYTYQGRTYTERWMHLRYIPKVGPKTRGQLVCHTGNTGTSTAPHFHQDIWVDDVRLDLIDSTNWMSLTVNPKTLYAIK